MKKKRTNPKKNNIKYSVCIRSRNCNCSETECIYNINFPAESNCLLNSIERNEKLSLKEVANRLNIPASTIKYIETKALKKLSRLHSAKKLKDILNEKSK